jgi:hypothetical protein
MDYKKATWKNGERKITGRWRYIWHRDCFHIILDKKDSITGLRKELYTHLDSPEWGKWKLVKHEL